MYRSIASLIPQVEVMPGHAQRKSTCRWMCAKRIQHGFSLLELLVVLLLVALTTSLVVVNIRHDLSSIVEGEARRFIALTEQMCQEAVVRGVLFRLLVEDGRAYRFEYYRGGEWWPVSNDDLLRPRQLPEDIRIELKDRGGKRAGSTQLTCGLDGDMPSFSALLSSGDVVFRTGIAEDQTVLLERLTNEQERER